ncbi:hypothetical protein VP01_482g1 [Puccinia sorghi]|uniref:Uncharacterized protein n=1 Tax=Puccinia sorghi TaxID=27349 RepID=A0A0L6UPE6_9BASI|nr:hypothetical protein VP01_482g1 [Puccinia sorghi]
MRINIPDLPYHYIKLGVLCESTNDANDLNLHCVLRDSMKDWFGEIGGLDPSKLSTIWLKNHHEVIIKVPTSEAHKVLNCISTPSCSLSTIKHPLSLRVLSHSHCLVNLA